MKILHLEDNLRDAETVRAMLTEEFPSCHVTLAVSRGEFLAALVDSPGPDIVLCDFALPGFDGLRALEMVREHRPDSPLIFLSGSIGEERAITALRAGAYDYVLKDNLARLPVAVRHALGDFAQRRRHREDELRLQELVGVIERAGEAIVVSDMMGRITLWNDGAARLYGRPASAALGRRVEEVLSHADFPCFAPAPDPAFETGEWHEETKVTTRDGRELVIDLRMTLVRDDAGRPSARLSIARDITEKKKLEAQSLRSQRLESLGLLAAGIAHDLNNVLAPVLVASPLLRQRASAAEDLRLLDILEKSAERGSALVRQILGFVHGASGEVRAVQARHVIREVAEVIHASFPKSIVLEVRTPGDLWPVQANPTQLHQILLNLAVNARDAMLPRGGTLRLAAENRVLSEASARAIEGARPGAFLVLEVADTGTGIAPAVLARIWEPFFTTKKPGEGTGLGLATVRGIAVAHGGFTAVEPQLAGGTTFRVFLPAAAPAEERSTAAQGSTRLPRGNGELVLVVDDEPSVCHVAAAILNRHGYRTHVCGDGLEAVAAFTERGADISVVLSDLAMPHLDGAALARALRKFSPDVKIIAVTGLGSAHAEAPAEADFAATLPKPFTVEQLLGTVHRVVHGRGAGVMLPRG